jgi:hypothetical protein
VLEQEEEEVEEEDTGPKISDLIGDQLADLNSYLE